MDLREAAADGRAEAQMVEVVVMFWRKIKSAPKDGRAILLWDGLPFVARFKDGEFRCPGGAVVGFATHWKSINRPFRASASVFWDAPRRSPFPQQEQSHAK